MLPNNRLDFISNIDKEYIEEMNGFRKKFIDVDEDLRLMSNYRGNTNEGAMRCLSLARTSIEQACMYTIKALCIMGEIKENQHNSTELTNQDGIKINVDLSGIKQDI